MVSGNNSDLRSAVTRRTLLKQLGMAAGVGLTGVSALSGSAAAESAFGQESFTTERIEIESFDGTTLVTTLYLPDDSGPNPCILSTHGWGGQRQDREPMASMYASNGYVVLTYDSRGFGESEGQVTSTGPNEQRDAQHLISWLAGRDEVMTDGEENPRIGMDGYSYGGGIQMRTASEDDRLDALIPRWVWHDLSYALSPNGVLKTGWTIPLQLSGENNGNISPELTQRTAEYQQRGYFDEEDIEYYQSRSAETRIQDIDTPALFISGWHDRLFWPNEALMNLRGLQENDVDARLLLTNVGHYLPGLEYTQTELQFRAQAAVSWMDYHLRDGPEPDLSTITYYRDESDSFTGVDQFPPSDASMQSFELNDGIAGDNFWVVSRPGEDEDVSSPFAAGETRQFEFPVEEDMEIIGTPTLTTTVGPINTDDGRVDLFFGLEDVAPDGSSTLIKDQVMALNVQEVGQIEQDLVSVQRNIDAGHTLRLSVTVVDDNLTDIPADYIPSALFDDSSRTTSAVILDTADQTSTLEVPMRPR